MFNKTFSKHSDIYVFDIIKSSTIEVSKFYSKDPFPNYKSSDNKSSILEIGNKNQLLKEFKETIGQNKDVLEVGCGTGQLSNYLAIGTNNRIVSVDPTLKSLEIANTFSKKNNIQNITYVKADITEDIFKNHLFDFIWCNGVLHHTEDPYKSFQSLIHTLKPKGYIVLGMYNFLGRIRTKFRKYLYKIFGKRLIMIMDPILRKLKSENQIDAWIRDQYAHPLESIHSYDEILKWFKINDIEYISSIPHSNFNYFLRKKHFKKENNGNFFSRFLNQFFMIFNKYGDDGGLFIFIGKKK